MKILCYGAGAVGCFVGGRLSAAGCDVTLLVRPQAAGRLQAHGLTLRDSRGGSVSARPRVITDLSGWDTAAAPPDLILVAVKSFDTATAAAEIPRLCGENTNVLTLQNGLGNEEMLAATMGEGRVISGVFTINVEIPETGTVLQRTSSGGVAVSELVPKAPRAESVRALFAAAGLKARALPDWRAMKWSKMLLNILANASCAILEMTPGEVFADPRLFRMEQRAFREVRAVMRRLGLPPVDVPGYPVRLLCAGMALPAGLAQPLVAPRVAGGRGDKMPSLAMDVSSGRGRSEIGFLNGAVARAAAECGLKAPVNAWLSETLSGIVAGRLDTSRFRRDPAALLAALAAGEEKA